MNRIVLIIMIFTVIGQASAQEFFKKNQIILENNFSDLKENTKEFLELKNNQKQSRSAEGRYYNYVYSLDSHAVYHQQPFVLTTANRSFISIWQDSTVKVNYIGGGSGPLNYRMAFNVFDPTADMFNNAKWTKSGEQAIRKADSYIVDTIWVQGTYKLQKANLTGDQLVMSVVKSQLPDDQYRYYEFGQTEYPLFKTNYYGFNSADTALISPTWVCDSIEVKAGENASKRTDITHTFSWDDTNFIKFYMFVLPTPITVTPSEFIGFSLKFISGDTWTPNVTFLNTMNRFQVTTFEEKDSSNMVYRSGTAGGGDLNTSGFMLSYHKKTLYASIALEGLSYPDDVYEEYMNVIYHAKSMTAWPVKINSISNIIDVTIYPNPATDHLIFNARFNHNQQKACLKISNAMGQEVYSNGLNIINGQMLHSINTSQFISGIYIYTLDVDGSQKVGKFTIR